MKKNEQTIFFTSEADNSVASCIENIKSYSKLISLDNEYAYKLNLRTKGVISSPVDIYMKDTDKESFICEPLECLLYGNGDINKVTTTLSNYIDYDHRICYNTYKFLNDHKLFNIKKPYTLDLKATFEKIDNTVEISFKLSYKILLFNHTPNNIQPRKIILSMDEAFELFENISIL